MGNSLAEVPSNFGDQYPGVIKKEVRHPGSTVVMIKC